MVAIARATPKVRDRQAERAAERERVARKVLRVGEAAVEEQAEDKVRQVEVAVAEVAAGADEIHRTRALPTSRLPRTRCRRRDSSPAAAG
jgi:hypothetical protein